MLCAGQGRMARDMTTSMEMIPFNQANVARSELTYVAEAIANGHISGNGAFTQSAEQLLAHVSGSPKVLLTTSCTHALEMSARLLDIEPGDEVIVPAFTFVSTASAFALAGAKPIFVDVDPVTLNLDVSLAQAAMTERTRAICTVHYAGIANDLDTLEAICRDKHVTLIEDNAHGLGGKYAGRSLGTFGELSTMSFHETKNVTCGEGGAIGINSSRFLARAEILREKGTNRSQFLRGQVDKYTWVDVGSSWIPSDLLAAFLLGQLENFANSQRERMAIWNEYDAAFKAWSKHHGVKAPTVPAEAEHPAHMYYLRFPDLQQRTRFIDHMRTLGIMAVFHYQALNTSPVGRSLGGQSGQCPVAEEASETLVRLPLFAGMKREQVERVIDGVLTFAS